MTWVTDKPRIIKCVECGVEVKTISRTRKRCTPCGDARDKLLKTPRSKRRDAKPATAKIQNV